MFSARISTMLWLALGSTSLLGCAREHSAAELIARAGGRGAQDDDQSPIGSDPIPFMGPLDAGSHVPHDVGVDASRPRPIGDARIPFPGDAGIPSAWLDGALPDAGPRDAGPLDAAFDASDAGLPAWQVSDSATLNVSVVATCDPPVATPDAGADAGCRTAGWHTPPCYRAPSDCPALKESTYCSGFNADGDLLLLGLDHGASCRIGHDARYPQGAGSNAFAQIGADIYSIESDVILKRSITDGSFDVAPIQAWTIFALGESLVIQALDGSIQRYASWEALKSGAAGEKLATATAGSNAIFGANHTTIAAAWPDGSLYLLTVGDARQRALRLVGYDRNEAGAIRGLDLSDDGRLFVSTDHGVSIYSSQDGHLISRMSAATMFGLSCEAGLAAGATSPVIKASARPGYYAPDGSQFIVNSSNCRGPFNGPRYVGEKAGPELLVIGNFFTDPNSILDERSTPHSLMLTTVEPTQWNVTVTATSKLERIFVNGSTATVVLQSPTTIPIETFFDSRSLGQDPGEWPALEESHFRTAVETQTGRAITESFGCHFGSSYVISDIPPACPTP